MSSETHSRAPETIPAQPFAEAERAAVYRAIHERRDMRHFCGGEVAPDVLLRLLRAARIVKAERQGKQVFYAAADAHISSLLANMFEHIAEPANGMDA